MGVRNRRRSDADNCPPFIGHIPANKTARDYINSFKQVMALSNPKGWQDKTTGIPFSKRNIHDYGFVYNWYSDVMLQFDTYQEADEKGILGQCYRQAYNLAGSNPDLTYFEGYAMILELGIPIIHAWCVDFKTKRIIDPTWHSKNDCTPAGYIGVPLNRKFVDKCMMRTGQYGVLDSLCYMKKDLSKLPHAKILDMRWYHIDKDGNRID